MGNFRIIDPNIKAEILNNVRNNGMSVSEAATQYSITSRTIYGWLKKEVVGGDKNLILENNRLKKEIEQLYNMLGRAMVELKRPKN